MLHLIFGALLQVTATTDPAKVDIPTDSVNQMLARTLSADFFWPERHMQMYYFDCQIQWQSFCASDIWTRFGTNYVGDWSGYHRSRLLAERRPSETPSESPGTLLETLLAANPSDGVALGRLILLNTVEADVQPTLARLRSCQTERWWCSALAGMALHFRSHFTQADSAFRESLLQMSDAVRCAWTDVKPLISDEMLPAYERLGCRDRQEYVDRLWWLADPLYSLDGNDRRAEHYARRVLDSIFIGLPSPFDHPAAPRMWDNELAEATLRFGYAASYAHATATGDPTPDLQVNFRTPSYQFVPSRAITSEESIMVPADWSLAAPLDVARERYHPGYDFVVDLADYQVAAFPRGDSMFVATAVDIEGQPLKEAVPFDGLLYLGKDYDEQPIVHPQLGVSGVMRATATAPSQNMLIALEATSTICLLSARVRYTLPAPEPRRGPSISQLLLFDGSDGTTKSVVAAADAMLGSLRVESSQPLGVFWEVYAVPVAEAVEYQIRLTQLDAAPQRSFFGAIGSLFRSATLDTLAVSWRETRAETQQDSAGVSTVLSIGDVRPGRYALRVSMSIAGIVVDSASVDVEVLSKSPSPVSLRQHVQQPVPDWAGRKAVSVERIRPRSAFGKEERSFLPGHGCTER